MKVTVVTDTKSYDIKAVKGQNLLELLRQNGVLLESPCGGNGTCGKCGVRIEAQSIPAQSGNETKSIPTPSEKEAEILSCELIKAGYRLSCGFNVNSDITVYLPRQSNWAQIVTEGKSNKVTLMPLVTKENVKLKRPDLNCQSADFERIAQASPNTDFSVFTNKIDIVKRLPGLIRKNDYNITLIKSGNKLLGIEAGDTQKVLYGAAFDIGTTTIAGYLVDMKTGESLCSEALLNPQRTYGADVISRIKFTTDSEDGLAQLSKLVLEAVNKCLEALCAKAHIFKSDIYALTFAGNTTMLHLLLGVSPKNIAAAPFIPVFTSMLGLNAQEIGLDINENGIALIMPSVSAYIGADTIGAVLSTGMYNDTDISLLIDIGTNGEIVLGNRDVLYACSSAAGPAFEGGSIRNGIGSVKGAINSISLEEGLHYKTIGDSTAIGICGTGIIDGIAEMLEIGLVDETGRLFKEWKPEKPEYKSIAPNIYDIDGLSALKITKDIYITQKDIRELQNAKAAIAAGIYTLSKESGISLDKIKNVYLAGGFGTYLNIESALKIGLIPAPLKGKIQSVGNAAGQGAVEALISMDSLNTAEALSKKIKYIELSNSKAFNDFYIDCMLFEVVF